MREEERHLAGLDVGTSKVAVAVGEILDGGRAGVAGVGLAPSRGVRGGVVVDAEAAAAVIATAAREAGKMANVEIESVVLALSGPHVEGVAAHGSAAVQGRNRVITPDDARRAIDAASALVLPAGRQILHVLLQDFVVDGQDGITRPVGLTCGAPLEANVYVVTCGTDHTRDLVACVNRAGLEVCATVAGPLATGEAILTPDDKDLGAAVVDMGADAVAIAVFERGALRHLRTLPLGASDDAAAPEVTPRREAANDLLRRAWVEIRAAGYGGALYAGLVLAGGDAVRNVVTDLAAQLFGCPVRRGSLVDLLGAADVAGGTTFAAAVGAVLHVHRRRTAEMREAGR